MYDPSEGSWRFISRIDFALWDADEDGHYEEQAVSRKLMMHEGVCYYATSTFDYARSVDYEVLRINKLDCCLESDKPSITLGERVDPEETFGVELEDSFDEPAQTIAFDKRKVGMVTRHCKIHKHHMES